MTWKHHAEARSGIGLRPENELGESTRAGQSNRPMKTATSVLNVFSAGAGLLGLMLAASCAPGSNSEAPASAAPAKAPAAPAVAEPAPPAAPAVKNPEVAIATPFGEIRLELYADKAPGTVSNFLQYAEEHHFDRTVFHRVIAGFMIQGGGFTADLQEKPTHPPIRNEADNGVPNARGTIAMARTPDPHSASAQFFINVADNASLNHRGQTMDGWGYCVFGRVTAGMDTVDKIAAVEVADVGPMDHVPKSPVEIRSVTKIESK